MMRKSLVIVLFSAVVSLMVRAQEAPTLEPGPTLAAVQSRGQLICGVDEEVFGFGFLNPNTGEISGLQVDLCRALAAAVTGEAEAVELRLHSLGTPIAELVSSDMDVFFDHSFTPGLEQLPVTGLDRGQVEVFYDGPSALVDAGNGFTGLNTLEGATVCLLADSLAADAFTVEMNRLGLEPDVATFASIAEMRAAFDEGRCTAQVLDRSLLEIIRQSSENPESLVVWPTPFAHRALVPLLRDGDPQWRDLVDWTLWGLIEAEQLGITSQNVESLRRRLNETAEAYLERVGEEVGFFLDPELGMGHRLALPNDFMYEVIHQVGNYGEIYDRNLGPQSALPIERGLNNLWVNGGLLHAPLWR